MGTNDNRSNSNKRNEDGLFLNPYNFVDVSGHTPRYPFEKNDKFHSNSGYIEVEIKTESPIFIPSPNETEKDKNDHKKMKFFTLNGQPALPSTSIKGLLRSTIETVSNSCFPHDYKQNTSLNYMFRRLSVDDEKESKEIRYLRPGILKKSGDNWYFVELDHANVLTVIDRYDSTSGETSETQSPKKLYFARNNKGEIEKISIKASTGGINGYINKKNNRHFGHPILVTNLDTENFKVVEVNGQKIDKEINQYNKKFPYICLKNQNRLYPRFFAIIRQKKLQKGNPIYKIKEISDSLQNLKSILANYKSQTTKEYNVEYAICEVILKTSFDIETKTQDKLFFKFKEQSLDTYLEKVMKNWGKIQIKQELVDQLQNLIAQRMENLKRMYKDDPLLRLQPTMKDIKDGMLVFYSKNEAHPYLTYTQVARVPYKYGIADVIKEMGKSFCSNLDGLCPVCNMFGTTNIKESNQKNPNLSIGGKISVEFGRCIKNNGFQEDVTLKPLGEPHPSFYQFYILDNRKPNTNNSDPMPMDYNIPQIKLGRKIYLKHNPTLLEYEDKQETKLNSTVQLLKTGAVFQFKIHYFNLSHYELGLLLYSLNIKYNHQPLDFQIGMGKPLGLGRIKITSTKVTTIDRIKRYTSLLEDGKRAMNSQEIEKYINIFQRIQVASTEKTFDPLQLNKKDINDYQIIPITEFKDLSYIKDFIWLQRINDGLNLKYPIKYPSKKNKKGELTGFKWFMDEKKKFDQRLFIPEALGSSNENNIDKIIPLYSWGEESEK